ncbi:brain-enriched guanylate kinase-associated protein-like [Salmo trutta]|uniref:brain-enriched guanylate kinase-associated protein-like n=1 Tax=Salmo trutta TaxID=8032 RepID=UPI001130B858|nr:brain-enriched guanylate kinase-associated protein-like [Salmo trutta]
MKKIYIGKTALKAQRNGCKHQKRSSLHDHKDDFHKRLSYTTHKLEMVESEFDSTRQYLETELRRAQEELEKFTDKLRRIQSSYAAQQRINQDLEDKVHRTSQHHDDEKRALSREIIVLNNHLLEAKITIEKLREDNDLYRKDCNLAAQLLQCSKSHHRAHKLSELPIDFQERVSSHIEKHGCGVTMALCHSFYSDAVPTAVIAKVLEKPEPGSSCPVTRSTSPQPLVDEGHDHDFVTNSVGSEILQRRTAYRTADLYCSDTALYCPERWQERRQSVEVHGLPKGLFLQAQNSNPQEVAFHSGNFSQHRPPSFHGEFTVGSLPASSSYSSFSQASEEEKGGEGCGGGPSSTMSSSHQALYMDWRDGGYVECKSTSSYEKDSPPSHSLFPKSHSFQHMAMPPSPNPAKGGGGSSPVYVHTPSCSYSEPYHSPHLASSHSVGLAQGGGGPRAVERSDSQASIDIPTEEELSGSWRQLSVEDINSYSYNCNPGRMSPYSFSEQHFTIGPAKLKLGPLYSSFQEGDDNVSLHSHVLDQCLATAVGGGGLSPSPKHPSMGLRGKPQPLYRAKEDSQDSECSQFLSGSLKDKESGAAGAARGTMNKEHVDVSPNSLAESLHHQNSLEASGLQQQQHYQRERVRPSLSLAVPRKSSQHHQKFGSTGTGLNRKDSLTKAQLYGTLLN